MKNTRRPLATFRAVLIALAFILVMPANITRADVITVASLELSTHALSTVANHTYEFVTPSGVDASTDTIVLTYQSGFSLTSLSAPGDFDLAVDNDAVCDGPFTDKTMAASAAAGTWGVGVSGQAVTLTAPTNAASGEITAGRCIQIQIGTNATSGSAGANRIVNPGSAGSYEVDVTGTFSDHGMYAVAIASIGSVTVTATAPTGSSSVTTTTTTTTTADTAAPVISNVVVSGITNSSATITWQTSEPAMSLLLYGPTTSYGGYDNDILYRTEHSVVIGGLSEGTVYHFWISATDSAGNWSDTGDLTFTTLDSTNPVISNVNVTNVTETSAVITWTTNELTTSNITLGARDPVWSETSLLTEHSALLLGLTPGTNYLFAVNAFDAASNTSVATGSFTTLMNLPPSNVLSLTATAGNATVALSWVNPPDTDLASIMVRWKLGSEPMSVTDGNLLQNSLARSASHTGLTNGTAYYYTVFSIDTAGLTSSGAVEKAIPQATIVVETPEDDTTVSDTTPDTTPTTTDTDHTTPPVSATDSDTTTTADGSPSSASSSSSSPLTPSAETLPALPTTTVSGSSLISEDAFRFFVARETIEIVPSNTTRSLHVLANRPLTVEYDGEMPADIIMIELWVGFDTYLMTPSSGIITPSRSVPLGIVIKHTDGTVQTISYSLTVVSDGRVVERTERGDVPIANASVALYEGETLANVVSYAENNPMFSSENGLFAWYIPNGIYRVRATANGFIAGETAKLRVYDNIVNPELALLRSLAPLDDEMDKILSSDKSVAGKTIAVVGLIAERTVDTIQIIRNDPGVQNAAIATAPAVTVATVGGAAALATSFNLFRFLQYLTTAPFLLWNRRKRKQWGVVYDSLRKVPVDLAVVRLVDAVSGKTVKSQVTDREGRYLFIVHPGQYRIMAQKASFIFPSAYLKDLKRDGEMLDLYHGEPIVVSDRDSVLAANIPLDPPDISAAAEPKKVAMRRWFRRIQAAVSVLGTIGGVFVAVVRPSALTIILAVLQIAVLLLFWRLAIPRKPAGWGIVYDNITRRPLIKAVVRIFEPTFNKLLETQVTDARGRYAFLVGPNSYFATYEKGGYKPVEVRPIDRTDAKEATFVSLKVGLDPVRKPPEKI